MANPAATDSARAGDWLVLVRPAHWVKNVVVLAPLVFAGRLLDPPSVQLALLTTAALCLLASGGYVLNDLHDAEADRHHPAKRTRPLARRAIRRGPALAGAAACLLSGLLLAYLVQRAAPPLSARGAGALGAFDVCVVYLALNLFYTLFLRRLPFVDVAALACLFVLRAYAGSAALQLLPSRWLLICGFCLALFLAFGKRRLEIGRLGGDTARTRPMFAAYTPRMLLLLVDLSAVLCVGSFVAYAVAPDTVAHVGSSALLFTAPIVALLVARHRRRLRAGQGEDPVEMLLRDRLSVAGFAVWLAAVLCVVYHPW